MASRKGSNWVGYILIALILAGFGGWFSGGVGGRKVDVGEVGGLPLSAQTYATALNNQLRAIEQQSGQTLTLEQAQQLGIDRQVLAGLVRDRVLDAEAARLALAAGDARVAQAVRDTPAFQGIDGGFDRQMYREVLSRNGLTETAYEASIRDRTTRTLLQAAVVGGLPEPLAYGATLAAQANETRDATWAVVAPDPAAGVPVPTDADLQAFYEANPDRFTAPETRRLDYAWLTPEALAPTIEVPDDEVAQAYEDRRDEFVQEERRIVERLVYPDDDAAAAARAQLDAGEATFEDLVEARGLTLSAIDLGDQSRGDLGEAADAVFAAATGDVVGPLPSSLGPALFRVNAVLAADETPLEEAAPLLREEIAQDRARRAISDLVPQIEDLLAGGAQPADLAERLGLEAGTYDLAEGASDGPAAYAEIRDAAAAAEEGGDPQLVELEDGGVAVLRVTAVTPPALRPFAEVEADVRAGWTAQARAEELLARAEADAQAIAGGATFESRGLAPRTDAAITRRGVVEGATPDLVAAVFSLEPGEALAIPTAEGALVVRLDAVTPAAEDGEAYVAERAAISEEVSGAIAQDLYDAFAAALQSGTEVRIDDGAIAAVTAQVR